MKWDSTNNNAAAMEAYSFFPLGEAYDMGVLLWETVNSQMEGELISMPHNIGILCAALSRAGANPHFLEIGPRHGGVCMAMKLFRPDVQVSVIEPFTTDIVRGGTTEKAAFWSNMRKVGLQDLAMYEGESIPWPINRRVKFDVVYIDGSHDYKDVKSDIISAMGHKPLYIVFDDVCNKFAGVTTAFYESSWLIVHLSGICGVLENPDWDKIPV